MKNKFFFLSFLLLLTISAFSQDEQKAKLSIQKYLASKCSTCKLITINELFDQTYPQLFKIELKNDLPVKYSANVVYNDGNQDINCYFHFDKDYHVLGEMSTEKMMEITVRFMFPGAVFTIDTSKTFDEK